MEVTEVTVVADVEADAVELPAGMVDVSVSASEDEVD